MHEPLSAEACRTLGCLIEKAVTTPEYYPMTLNALVAACNQKTNRDPVVDYDEDTVLEALDELRDRNLALRVDVAGSRVPKFRHSADTFFELTSEERAVLCVLLLRGPQTAGEIRARSERLFLFRDLERTEETIRLMEHPENDSSERRDYPLLGALPRLPGRKETRYLHTLGGPLPENTEVNLLETPGAMETIGPIPSRQRLTGEISELRQQIESLKAELAQTRAQFAQLQEKFEVFRQQFE